MKANLSIPEEENCNEEALLGMHIMRQPLILYNVLYHLHGSGCHLRKCRFVSRKWNTMAVDIMQETGILRIDFPGGVQENLEKRLQVMENLFQTLPFSTILFRKNYLRTEATPTPTNQSEVDYQVLDQLFKKFGHKVFKISWMTFYHHPAAKQIVSLTLMHTVRLQTLVLDSVCSFPDVYSRPGLLPDAFPFLRKLEVYFCSMRKYPPGNDLVEKILERSPKLEILNVEFPAFKFGYERSDILSRLLAKVRNENTRIKLSTWGLPGNMEKESFQKLLLYFGKRNHITLQLDYRKGFLPKISAWIHEMYVGRNAIITKYVYAPINCGPYQSWQIVNSN